MFEEGADREDYGFVQRLRLDVHGMPDAVGSGERNSAGAGGHVREDIIEGEETADMISSSRGSPSIPEARPNGGGELGSRRSPLPRRRNWR